MQVSTRKLHYTLLLPSLLITMILVNQTNNIAIITGQVMGWLSYLFAGIVVYNAFEKKLFVLLLFALVIFTKVVSIASTSESIQTIYIIFQNCLFCISGSVLSFQRPNLLYKQIMIFCILNVIPMILQVTGLGGEFAMFLTTHGEAGLARPVLTFFKEEGDLDYLLIQGRPAGLTQANIILSLIIIFAIALHFSRHKNVFIWGTPILTLLIILSMAKMAYLGFIVTGIIVFIWGERFQKFRILRGTLLIAIFLCLYSVIFPGLASVNLAKETIDASIFMRANEIMFALTPDYLIDGKRPYFEGTIVFNGEEGEFVSGIAIIMAKVYNNLVLFVLALISISLIYVYGLTKIKIKFPEIWLKVITVLVVICLFPFTHPIWPFQIYWFMLGCGLLPFYIYTHPKFIERLK